MSPLRDQLSISTPELVAIEFPLAGVGSRFIAILLDYLLQGAVVLLLTIAFALVLSGAPGVASGAASMGSGMSQKWVTAIAIAIPFLLEWAYFALFEAFWRGQTPGKRLMKIRVIQQTGRPISLFESLGRNLLRAIDWLPGFYIVGVISMFVTRRQQRLGDLVAGTLVVHERELQAPLGSVNVSRTFTAAVYAPVEGAAPPPRVSRIPADALAAFTLADLQAIEAYMARRLDVSMETRAKLAGRLAEMVTAKLRCPVPEGMSQETLLEEVASGLRSTGTLDRR